MNVNRVTISALGTTGVLLAASLTMLALVSALVTFDGWPRGVGASSVGSVPVEPMHSPRLVRAVRHAPGTAGRGAPRRSAATALAAGRVGAGRTGARRAGGAPVLPTNLAPRVPRRPPGEGDPSPTHYVVNPGGRKSPNPGPGKGPVGQAACTASQAVSGVNAAAGGTVGTACKVAPAAYAPVRESG
jgi:hypothetical protein